MHFLLQSDNLDPHNGKNLDLDIVQLKTVLDRLKIFSEYTEMKYADLKNADVKDVRNTIPVGTIPFVEEWLKKCHNIDYINPIEIPYFLRMPDFIKRDYRIVPYNRIPETGEYFIKDVSRLKRFVFFGNRRDIEQRYEGTVVDKTHLFQVSEVVKILSEHRVYIIDGKIENVCNYNGSPLVSPDSDVIIRANRMYMAKPDYPRSLTMDVMVTENGTELVEIHPFIACGLYGTLWGDNLGYAYRDGIRYVTKHNTPIVASES